jgi:hypothetical protein
MHDLVRPHTLSTADPFWSNLNEDPLHLSPVPSHALPPPHSPRSQRQSSAVFSSENPVPDGSFGVKKTLGEAISKETPLLLLAGYSYGALITTQLPNLSEILSIFNTPITGSAASEIRLRAQQLAKQQNEIFARLAVRPQSKSDDGVGNELQWKHVRGRSLQANELLGSRKISAASSVRVGGEETDSDLRRASQDSYNRRSINFETPERVRRSVDRVRSLGGHGTNRDYRPVSLPRRQTSSPQKGSTTASLRTSSTEDVPFRQSTKMTIENKMPAVDLGEIKAAYLLVSPLYGLVTNLATMWTFPHQSQSKRKDSKVGELCEEERKLINNNTLAIFGDHDVFTSTKKLRSWASRLSNAKESHFIYAEISEAGHFWQEDGVVGKLKGALNEFVQHL